MDTRGFFVGTVKLSLAILGAMVALVALLGLVWFGYLSWEKLQEKPLEQVKEWSKDLTNPLQMVVEVRTKLVDKRLMATVSVRGYPAYLSDPRLAKKNRETNAGFTLIFYDADKFKVFEKQLPLSELANRVDDKGTDIGLRGEFEQYFSNPDSYRRFASFDVLWDFETKLPAFVLLPELPPASAASALKAPKGGDIRLPKDGAPAKRPEWMRGTPVHAKDRAASADGPWMDYRRDKSDPAKESASVDDHCAPGISKAERLRRLALHGVVRQSGSDSYNVGGRSLHFFQSELLACN